VPSPAQKFRDSLKGAPVNVGSEAVTRITRTPIEFWMSNLSQEPKAVRGQYLPVDPDGKIQIVTDPNRPPNYGDLMNTIHHEDIHSALSRVPTQRFKDILSGSPGLDEGWRNSGRAGTEALELPAYLGAYDPEKIKIAPDARQRYINYMISQLPEREAGTFERILKSWE